MPGKTAGKLEVYDTSSGVAVGPWDIAAGRILTNTGQQSTVFMSGSRLTVSDFHEIWYTPQSTCIYRVPYCMSPRRNWDSPPPLSPASVPLPLEPKRGGGHTRLRVRGWGSPNADDWRNSLALCLLCGLL